VIKNTKDWNIINKPAYYFWPQRITDDVSKDYGICEIALCYGNIAGDQCNVMQCNVTLCYIMFMLCLCLCYVMLCYVMLCYVMLCYVMLCYVMLCYVMLCYVMLFYVMLFEDECHIVISWCIRELWVNESQVDIIRFCNVNTFNKRYFSPVCRGHRHFIRLFLCCLFYDTVISSDSLSSTY
jgi:hypothetical protein